MTKNVLAKVQTPIQMPNQSLGDGIQNEDETTHQIGAKRPSGETTQGESTQGRNDSGAKRPEAVNKYRPLSYKPGV